MLEIVCTSEASIISGAVDLYSVICRTCKVTGDGNRQDTLFGKVDEKDVYISITAIKTNALTT